MLVNLTGKPLYLQTLDGTRVLLSPVEGFGVENTDGDESGAFFCTEGLFRERERVLVLELPALQAGDTPIVPLEFAGATDLNRPVYTMGPLMGSQDGIPVYDGLSQTQLVISRTYADESLAFVLRCPQTDSELLFFREEGAAYRVEVPDLPGCVGHGANFEAALRDTLEALQERRNSGRQG